MFKLNTIESAATFIIAFLFYQLVLFYFSGFSAAFNELNTGFSNFVDVTSKFATSITLIWAIYNFTHSNTEKEIMNECEQIRSLSEKLIDYVQSNEFILNKATANIVISYLDIIFNTKHEKNKDLPEKKLVLNILYQIFRSVTTESVLGIKSTNTYASVCQNISDTYSDLSSLKLFDFDFYSNLITRNPSNDINTTIRPPEDKIQPHQIIKIASFILEIAENDLKQKLSNAPESPIDIHHRLPVLFGIFCTYHLGSLFINSENTRIYFSKDGLLMSCRRP